MSAVGEGVALTNEHQRILNTNRNCCSYSLLSRFRFGNLQKYLTKRFLTYLLLLQTLLVIGHFWFVRKTEVIYVTIEGRTETSVQLGKQSETEKQAPAPGWFDLSMDNPLVGGNFWMDGMLCAAIEKLLGDVSIVDFGGGLGQYGRCLMRNYDNLINRDSNATQEFASGFIETMKQAKLFDKPKIITSYEGYDGSTNIEIITNNWMKQLNLAVPFDLGKKFDWVLSLEVGEHIPKEFEAIFMDNLVKHSSEGIILSWAVEGQGGYNHINNQNNSYVISKMTERGLTHDLPSQELLRKMATFYYFRDTVMVFRVKKTS